MTILQGKVAFVTGASKGIGAAIATALSDEGVKLGLASRSGDDHALPAAIGLPCDVRDRRRVEAAMDETVARFGPLDILVVNAGVGSYGTFLETKPEDLDEMLDVNVRGMFNTVRAALPHLIANPVGGDIVTIASEAGRRGLPGEAAYVATKFAQVGFTRSLDHELRQHGIRCTNVCPGGVATEFGMGRGLRYPGMPELKDMMTASDIAEAVTFVLTRPRTFRVLEIAMRHMTEPSWG